MIRTLVGLDPEAAITTLYEAIAAAISCGAVLGVIGVWVSVAVRGGQR